MSFLDAVETNTREKLNLPPGSYGSKNEPGLEILAYSEKGSKKDKSGAMRHSFLVAATKPSREALKAHAEKNKNGNNGPENIPFEGPDYEGTAFLAVTLHEMWLNPEACALAFTEASRNKEGAIQADYVAQAIKEGEVTEESIDKARHYFETVAGDKVLAANTPPDQSQEAYASQFAKELQQIAIKVGQFLTLQDWAGIPRSLHLDPVKLVGANFSGKVETSNIGKGGSEVVSIYAKAKAKK